MSKSAVDAVKDRETAIKCLSSGYVGTDVLDAIGKAHGVEVTRPVPNAKKGAPQKSYLTNAEILKQLNGSKAK